jgi:hypothetical protein
VSNNLFELVHTGIQIGNFYLDYYADELVHIRTTFISKSAQSVVLPIVVLAPTTGIQFIDKTEQNLRKVRSSAIFVHTSRYAK